jgi:parvulin-like peptidyl-prolyl isomerase
MNEPTARHTKTGLAGRAAILLLAALAALLCVPAAAAQEPAAADPLVLRVGTAEEHLDDFNGRFEIAIRGLIASMGIPLTPEVRTELDSLKPEYLEQRATDLALVEEAARRGIEVPESDVDATVDSILGSLPLGADQASLLQEAGFRDEAQLRELVLETETIQRLVDLLTEEIEVSDADVLAFYEANPETFATEEEVCARHILVADLETAEGLQAELAAGADFAELAREHSTDTGSGSNGGELGCFGRGMMVAPFEEAAFNAEIDEVAGPVESQFGQHLIQVYGRNEAGVASLEETTPFIRDQLGQQKLGEVISAIRAVADVELFPENLQ